MDRHSEMVAAACLWMIYVGEAKAVAEVTAALVDAGGLRIACDVKTAMVILGESLAGSPCYELIKCAQHLITTDAAVGVW